ncbi:ferrous iron transport protein A [Aestuariirhabdus sp. Z084]|uniref:FeoA family protein n=1 Tax=Aestuariirhabdus haliotis TaxID=2918751 RepID=UPI00201B3CCA|nr:FeoA family protein [Aestuariirhabdus haliotis]MCL6416911.1 ferrous iron transport protein A [Aestuariirhabdus haliotis]MCL6420927.1 ferrous iron transport protein A [Aestuariirhabdus haliotis]
MTLDKLPVGQAAVVQSYHPLSTAQSSQFLALGIVPETPVQVLRTAPFGCPLQVKIGHSLLSIRKAEAALVVLKGSE